MASRGGGVTDDKIKKVRAIMGPAPSDMDIIRALYQSKNDISAAVNILFDPPTWNFKQAVPAKRKAAAPSPPAPAPESNKPSMKEPVKPAPGNGKGARDVAPLEATQTSSRLAKPSGPHAVAAEAAKDSIQGNSKAVDMLDSNQSNEVVILPNKTDLDMSADLSLALVPTQATRVPVGGRFGSFSTKFSNMPVDLQRTQIDDLMFSFPRTASEMPDYRRG